VAQALERVLAQALRVPAVLAPVLVEERQVPAQALVQERQVPARKVLAQERLGVAGERIIHAESFALIGTPRIFRASPARRLFPEDPSKKLLGNATSHVFTNVGKALAESSVVEFRNRQNAR
jgi:hypothetical protein